MKKIVVLLIVLFSINANAQNYQCLQSGVRHYFTNGNGYLRGIRIDSVSIYSDSVIYYPYRTPRGYYGNVFYPTDAVLDANGGSWLGKRVVEKNDGTFIFDNIWHNSVIIKTKANIGDTWIFYLDTTSLFYNAQIIAIDTLTLLGALDSVKSILITAHNAMGIVITDPVDSFILMLSKNNGFAQVFDLYTFPYHAPDTAYTPGLDYYLDKSINSMYEHFSLPSIPRVCCPIANNSIFKLINFINPTFAELYNWNIGDIYQYSTCGFGYFSILSSCDPPMYYYLDTVVNKNIATDVTQCYFSGVTNTLYTPSYYTPYYNTTINVGMFNFTNQYLIDTFMMPEEYKQGLSFYYYPNDSSHCIVSPLYLIVSNYLTNNIYYNYNQPPNTITLNKLNIGLVHAYTKLMGEDEEGLISDTTLIFYQRDGVTCGSFINLDVKEAYLNSKPQIFPNPVTDLLTIKSPNIIYNIEISNTIGQIVYHQAQKSDNVVVNVSKLKTGLYFVKINNTEVSKFLKE